MVNKYYLIQVDLKTLIFSAGSPFSRSESVPTLCHPSSCVEFRPQLNDTTDMFSPGQTTGINTPHRTHAAERQHIKTHLHTETPSILFKQDATREVESVQIWGGIIPRIPFVLFNNFERPCTVSGIK